MRILRIRAVCERIGLSKTRVYDLEREGRFPRRLQLSEHSVGWYEHEVDEWLGQRARATELRPRGKEIPEDLPEPPVPEV